MQAVDKLNNRKIAVERKRSIEYHQPHGKAGHNRVCCVPELRPWVSQSIDEIRWQRSDNKRETHHQVPSEKFENESIEEKDEDDNVVVFSANPFGMAHIILMPIYFV
jgi:hypothetical protein